jgi:hypothetical protein
MATDTTHPRTAIADVVLDGAAVQTDAEIDALLDVSFDATEAAIRNRHQLVDFEEFPARGVL